MLIRSSKQPYNLFYLNSDGKYEAMALRYTYEIPKAFMQKTSYLYSNRGRGKTNSTSHWFKCDPNTFLNGRFKLMDTENVPSEVLALRLLIED